jgi:hypothetical protein
MKKSIKIITLDKEEIFITREILAENDNMENIIKKYLNIRDDNVL